MGLICLDLSFWSEQKELMCYGVMFTCFCSHAIHVENAQSLDADSFSADTMKFYRETDNIRQMRDDNQSDFLRVGEEFRKSFQEINHSRITEYLQMHGTNWITWINNPLTTSHMGGFWEGQIITARRILNALIKYMEKFRRRTVTYAAACRSKSYTKL